MSVLQEKRIVEEFKELTEIDSVSFCERQMADRLILKLTNLGFEVMEDRTGVLFNGNSGNVYGYLKGEMEGPPILLSAHMDTVIPGKGKRAVQSPDGPEGMLVSAGETVLGADDVCGLVEILEGIRMLQESGTPHRDVEVIFSIAEEAYTKGTSVMNYDQLQAEHVYVFDLSGRIGTAALQAPSILSFQIIVTGKASHAGFEPEKGIHAIQVMSEIISSLKLGHLDEETTLNIGKITGGTATNIVPETCVCSGEVRSFHHQKALDTLESVGQTARTIAQKYGAQVLLDSEVHMKAYQTGETDPVVLQFAAACEKLNIPCELTTTFGGSDNNNFVNEGMHGLVISCGMYQVHSTQEYTLVEDLVKGAQLAAELLRQPFEG